MPFTRTQATVLALAVQFEYAYQCSLAIVRLAFLDA